MFTDEELTKLRQRNPKLVEIFDEGGTTFPYLNYDEAIKILNDVTKQNYDFEIIGEPVYNFDMDTVQVKVRLTVRKGDQSMFRESHGTQRFNRKKETGDILYFQHQVKEAQKDGLKYIMLHYFEIGKEDIAEAKEKIDKEKKEQKKNYNHQQSGGKTYKCTNPDCETKAECSEAEKNYSLKNHGRILCQKCQKKFPRINSTQIKGSGNKSVAAS